MSALMAIAWNGFREARRNRVTVVVGAFALVVLLSASLVTEATVHTMDRVAVDFGLGMMALILVFLAIFLTTGILSREIERRTIFLTASKPLSRSTFLIGRYLGAVITLTVLELAMAGVFFAELLLLRAPIDRFQLLALVGLWFELGVIAGIGFLVSSFASQTVSAIVVTGLYLAGHLSSDIYALGARAQSAALQWVAKGTYYLLPNLERVNFRPQATYQVDVPAAQVLQSLGYAAAFAALLIAAACWIFERRDFR